MKCPSCYIRAFVERLSAGKEASISGLDDRTPTMEPHSTILVLEHELKLYRCPRCGLVVGQEN